MHEVSDEHLLERMLHDNEHLAEENREHFDEMSAFVTNFMSAPGAGKTTLIIEIAKRLGEKQKVCVVEGDMVGELDVVRLRKDGISALQISTGRSCHLDAAMIARLLHSSTPPEGDFIIIENVGNLVCPAEFPLGENLRIVLLSVTEGDDKPIKYPVIFRNCDAVVLTKCDLLPHVEFDCQRVENTIGNLNKNTKVFRVSAKTQEGVKELVDWLETVQTKIKPAEVSI